MLYLNVISAGANAIKLFTTVVYEFSSKTRMFVLVRSFQPSLKYVECMTINYTCNDFTYNDNTYAQYGYH
jgi:hypothetical protein